MRSFDGAVRGDELDHGDDKADCALPGEDLIQVDGPEAGREGDDGVLEIGR